MYYMYIQIYLDAPKSLCMKNMTGIKCMMQCHLYRNEYIILSRFFTSSGIRFDPFKRVNYRRFETPRSYNWSVVSSSSCMPKFFCFFLLTTCQIFHAQSLFLVIRELFINEIVHKCYLLVINWKLVSEFLQYMLNEWFHKVNVVVNFDLAFTGNRYSLQNHMKYSSWVRFSFTFHINKTS